MRGPLESVDVDRDMMLFFDYPLVGAVLVVGIIAGGMYASLEAGRRHGRRHLERALESGRAGLGGMEAALYALFGLLLAFSFGGAAGRFEARRSQAYDEAKVVKTAWRRLDLLPEAERTQFRGLVRRHLSDNLKAYETARSLRQFKEDMERLGSFEDEMWSDAVGLSRRAETQGAAGAVQGAFADVFTSRVTRTEAVEKHPHFLLLGMLFFLALVSSYLTGFAMAEAKVRSWPHIWGYLGIVSVTIYVIMDLEFPRIGLIRVDSADEALRSVLRMMN